MSRSRPSIRSLALHGLVLAGLLAASLALPKDARAVTNQTWTVDSELDDYQDSDGYQYVSDDSLQTSDDGQESTSSQTSEHNPDGSGKDEDTTNHTNPDGTSEGSSSTTTTNPDGSSATKRTETTIDRDGNRTTTTTTWTRDKDGKPSIPVKATKKDKVAPPTPRVSFTPRPTSTAAQSVPAGLPLTFSGNLSFSYSGPVATGMPFETASARVSAAVEATFTRTGEVDGIWTWRATSGTATMSDVDEMITATVTVANLTSTTKTHFTGSGSSPVSGTECKIESFGDGSYDVECSVLVQGLTLTVDTDGKTRTLTTTGLFGGFIRRHLRLSSTGDMTGTATTGMSINVGMVNATTSWDLKAFD
jgi:hypothetical protein